MRVRRTPLTITKEKSIFFGTVTRSVSSIRTHTRAPILQPNTLNSYTIIHDWHCFHFEISNISLCSHQMPDAERATPRSMKNSFRFLSFSASLLPSRFVARSVSITRVVGTSTVYTNKLYCLFSRSWKWCVFLILIHSIRITWKNRLCLPHSNRASLWRNGIAHSVNWVDPSAPRKTRTELTNYTNGREKKVLRVQVQIQQNSKNEIVSNPH